MALASRSALERAALPSLADITAAKARLRLASEAREVADRADQDRFECQKLSTFLRRGWRYMDPSDFITNWHIDAICEHLEAVSRGEVRRLLINMPPRHMKSLGVSVAWPAWSWSQSPGGPLIGPQVRWLFSSYAQTLSTRDNVKCRRLIESPWYRGVWGDRFSLVSDQNTKTKFENDKHGYRMATSVDGALTGEGGDIIVVDDPHNVREAESPAVREAALAWWDEAMSTRLNDPKTGAYVVIMQRVHESDLSGHILAREHKDWTHLCLPARYEPDHPHVYSKDPRTRAGQLLWPERIDEDSVKELEGKLGSYGTAGQLQQRPAPREGGLFKRAWLPVVDELPVGINRWVRAWDLGATAGGGDPTAGVKVGRGPDGVFYVAAVAREQVGPADVERLVLSTASQDGQTTTIRLPQDPGAAGKAYAQTLVRLLAGYPVKVVAPTGDKQTRALPAAAQAEVGNVRLLRGPWNEAFIDELCTFPAAAHDDQVDAFADAINELALAVEHAFTWHVGGEAINA